MIAVGINMLIIISKKLGSGSIKVKSLGTIYIAFIKPLHEYGDVICPRCKKICLQDLHPHSLISAFVFFFFFWTISYIDLLVSVAEETGLKLALSESPKTGFLTSRPKWGKRLVFFFQETARNHFWEAGMLMQSYMLNIVQ